MGKGPQMSVCLGSESEGFSGRQISIKSRLEREIDVNAECLEKVGTEKRNRELKTEENHHYSTV